MPMRDRFPILQKKTYFNSCSQGALSIDVQQAYAQYLKDWDEKGSPWELWVERSETARQAFAGLINADANEVADCTSVSAGVSALASALDFSGARNKVVVSDFEFPTIAQIWHAQEARGARVVHVPAAGNVIPLERFADAIDERTKIVSITHVCFRNGSKLDVPAIVEMAHRKETPYKLAIVKAIPSFSGLWVYKDDHTEVRILGAIARVLPDLFTIESVEQAIMEEWNDPLKAISARKSYDRTTTRTVQPTEGNPEKPYEFTFPKWWEMREGVAIPSIPMGAGFGDPATGAVGGYRPDRNPTFKKFSTRTMRPVVDFDTCVKCTLCWLQCPDSCFDVTPDGFYDANMDACCGCGVCEAVCPVTNCITMVNESEFANNASQWEMWKKDKAVYKTWLQQKIAVVPERSHGFRFRGQYEEQVATLVAEGLAGAAGGGEEITEKIVSDAGEASAGGVE